MFISMFDHGDILDGLNEQQRRAATHEGGPLLVLAGAGTGKTRTLVARAAWLRDSLGLQPSRILLLTFTRRAASDMLARAAATGNGAAERIYGGTFHAIAHKIIRQHAESFSLPPQFTILDQADTTEIMDVLRPDHGLAEVGQRAPRAATCGDIYTRCVNTGRPVSDVVAASFPWCIPFTSQLSDLFRAYTARKRARYLVDFDDLLLLWQAALADPGAGPVLRGMFGRGAGRGDRDPPGPADPRPLPRRRGPARRPAAPRRCRRRPAVAARRAGRADPGPAGLQFRPGRTAPPG
jgi:DNA helicase-2/ATP-dependent DNA helicase PcrA